MGNSVAVLLLCRGFYVSRAPDDNIHERKKGIWIYFRLGIIVRYIKEFHEHFSARRVLFSWQPVKGTGEKEGIWARFSSEGAREAENIAENLMKTNTHTKSIRNHQMKLFTSEHSTVISCCVALLYRAKHLSAYFCAQINRFIDLWTKSTFYIRISFELSERNSR